MKLIGSVLKSVSFRLAYSSKQPHLIRRFSANTASAYDDREGTNSFESTDDFERRIFGDVPGDSKSNSFFQKFDRIQKGQDLSGLGSKKYGENKFDLLEGLDETFSTLSDGLDGKLQKEATYFEFDPEEIENDENYAFRPDKEFRLGDTYDLKDLDLTKPGVRKPFKRYEFETTTEEVLRKADFRNVRFLANFITEAGVIIKRSKTKISAKAQRKVAREIKTARAFGLMPFTTMGTKEFMFGRTMQDQDDDYAYEAYEPQSYAPNFVDEDRQDPQ